MKMPPLLVAAALVAVPTSRATTDLVSLGNASFTIDPAATSAAYTQSASELIFGGNYALGDTLGGSFAVQDWSSPSYTEFGVLMTLTGTNPNLPFSVQLYDASFNVINTYGGTTVPLVAGTPSYTPLTLNIAGTGILTSVAGIQFTWDGGGAINTTVTKVVASGAPTPTPTPTPTPNPNLDPGRHSIEAGKTAVLVGPAVPGATYQWLRGGVAIAGATSRQLDLSPFAPAKAGRYNLRISVPAPGLAPTPEPWLVTLKDPTVLIYSLTGTVTETSDPSGATAGAAEASLPLGGFLLLDREAGETVLLVTRTTTVGKVVVDRRYLLEERPDVSILSTGPVPGAGKAKGSRTVVAGARGEQVEEPEEAEAPLWIAGDLDTLWLSGNDALVPLLKVNPQASVIAPLVMTGFMGTLFAEPVQIDNVAVTAKLDVLETLAAWNAKSSLADVQGRLVSRLRNGGFKAQGE